MLPIVRARFLKQLLSRFKSALQSPYNVSELTPFLLTFFLMPITHTPPILQLFNQQTQRPNKNPTKIFYTHSSPHRSTDSRQWSFPSLTANLNMVTLIMSLTAPTTLKMKVILDTTLAMKRALTAVMMTIELSGEV